MSNLPKYYFGDISAVVMAEIMDEMLRLKPEPELSDLEEVDDWLNGRTTPGRSRGGTNQSGNTSPEAAPRPLFFFPAGFETVSVLTLVAVIVQDGSQLLRSQSVVGEMVGPTA